MNRSIILFDGVCNLCNGFVQFVIARDSKNVFTFGSLQSHEAQKLLAPFGFDSEKLSTVVLMHEGIIFTQSTAALKILRELRGWRWAYVFIIVPPFLRDIIYNIVAKHRYTIFGKRDSCMVPTPEQRDKFIDSTA